jgi:hypothetical protein
MTKRQASYAIATVIIFLFLCATTLTYQGGNHLQIEISSTVEKAIFVVRNIAVRSNFIDLSKRTLVEGQILFYAGSHDPTNVLKSNYLLIRSHRTALSLIFTILKPVVRSSSTTGQSGCSQS